MLPLDELLAEALLAYEAGTEFPASTNASAASCANLPEELLARLERDKACLDLLRQLRKDLSDDQSHISGEEITAPLHPQAQHGPRRIGRFEIRETLGVGGFGVVYRAFDPRTKRDVALKIPRLETLASAELQQRFEQEAWAAARLNHENIVAVLEAGNDGFLPYIAAVYYPGETLAAWLKSHPQAIVPRTAALFTRRLAEGVAHAHQQGVQHRDIKPSNVLLVARTPGGPLETLDDATPKLMDFGLAKLTSETHDMTRSGAILGTIRYMSPEQAAGRIKSIGPASDVYGLGALLYELLVGAPPFAAASDLEVLRRIQDDEPSRIRTERRTVPRDLETICLKALAKDPARRYPTAAEMAADLDRYLAGQTILAKPATPLERVTKWARRYPAWASLFVVVGLSALLLIAGLMLSNSRIRAERDRTLASEQQLREYAYSADMRLAQEAWERSTPQETISLLKRYIPNDGEGDIRGIEWHYLWNNAHRGSQVIGTQPSPVLSLAVSPDEKLFLTGGHDGMLRVWSLPERRLLREVRGDAEDDINAIIFSPDGQRLYTAGDDHQIRIWNTSTWEVIQTLEGHKNWIGAMALYPRGPWLVSGDADGRVFLWNTDTSEFVRELFQLKKAVKCIQFHPKKPWIVSFSDKPDACLWDFLENRAPTESPDGRFELPPGNVYRATFDATGERLFASREGALVSWQVGSNGRVKFDGNRIPPWGEVITLSLHGEWLLSGGGTASNPDILVRPAKKPEVLTARLRGHTNIVRALAPLQDEKTLLSGSDDGSIRIWQYHISHALNSRHNLGSRVGAIQWSPTSDVLLVATDLGGIFAVRDLFQTEPKVLSRSEQPIGAFAFTSDGQRFIAIDLEGGVHWGDLETGLQEARYHVAAEVEHACLNRMSTALFYTAGKDVVCVDAVTGVERWRFTQEESSTAIDAREDELLVTCNDGSLRAFEPNSGKLVRETVPDHGRINRMDRTEDGRHLVLACQDKSLRILDAQTWSEEQSIPYTEARSVYFIDSGRRLLTIDGHDLSLLNAKSGQLLLKWNDEVDINMTSLNHDRTILAARVYPNHVAIIRLKTE